jgi:hypothetical protein
MQFLRTSLAVLLAVQYAAAATWCVPSTSISPICSSVLRRYFLEYHTPSGAQFTSFSGTLVAPKLPGAGTYYLWPGLQPADNSGVLQQVLDGRSGEWWIGASDDLGSMSRTYVWA